MKTYILSEEAMRRIESTFQLVESMIESETEYTLDAFTAQFDKIESIAYKDYSSEVQADVLKSLSEGMKVPFPNFDISKYQIDLKNDHIKRGDGTVLNTSNATVAEKTLLHIFDGIITEANEEDSDIMGHLDDLRSSLFQQ